jgi:fatty-acid desaturase
LGGSASRVQEIHSMLDGILDFTLGQALLSSLALTHITIAAVTIYLHRHQAHRALDLHPIVSHFFRFWLWLTTGMRTKDWVAVHRKHHAKVTARRSTVSARCCSRELSSIGQGLMTRKRWRSTDAVRRTTGSSDIYTRDTTALASA